MIMMQVFYSILKLQNTKVFWFKLWSHQLVKLRKQYNKNITIKKL